MVFPLIVIGAHFVCILLLMYWYFDAWVKGLWVVGNNQRSFYFIFCRSCGGNHYLTDFGCLKLALMLSALIATIIISSRQMGLSLYRLVDAIQTITFQNVCFDDCTVDSILLNNRLMSIVDRLVINRIRKIWAKNPKAKNMVSYGLGFHTAWICCFRV